MSVLDSSDSSSRARWALLLLSCLGLFGGFYSYDIPSALNEQFRQSFTASTGISDKEFAYLFNSLYSVYSVPNVVLPLILGIAIDRYGYRIMICILSFIVFLGQLVFTLGIARASWPTMIAGRLIFGLGGETLQVAQACLIYRWFKGNEVAFAMGLNLSAGRCGSVVNDWLSPAIANRWGLLGASSVGAALIAVSFLCNIASVAIDKVEGERANVPESRQDETFSPRDLFKLPKLYWNMVAICVSIYCGILPFNNIASAFFVETRYAGLPLVQAQALAGSAMSLLFLSSVIGTPAVGLFVDHVGLRRHLLLLSAVMLLSTHLLIFTLLPTMSMTMLGMVYMVFAGAWWPAVALTVPQRLLGTAVGLATAFQNAGLAVVPMIVGHLQATAAKGDFRPVIKLFAFCGLVGTAASASLLLGSNPNAEILDWPSSEAEKRQKLGETLPLQPPTPAEAVARKAVAGLTRRDG